MTGPVERFTAGSLVRPEAGARVMRPHLPDVATHWHDYYELSLVLSGRAEHVVNGEAHALGPGSAFLLSPTDFHGIRLRCPEPLVCFNAVLDPRLVERQLVASGGIALRGFPWLVEDSLDLEHDLARLQREIEEPRPGSGRMVESVLSCLVVEIARRVDAEPTEPAEPDGPAERGGTGGAVGLRSAVLYVDRHFREPLSLADAAAAAHLSPHYFSERFRHYTGTPFQTYLQDRRLDFARSLLASTDLSVTEACHASGFGTLSHFGRAYRRRYGEPPSARRLRENGRAQVTM